MEYIKHGRFTAPTPPGLEKLAADELAELGAEAPRPGYRAVSFGADRAALYRVNLRSRLCTHVLAPLLTFDCHSDKYLHRTALKKIDWSSLMDVDGTLAVAANVSQSNIRHSQFAAQRLKDAVCDQFRDRTGRRPSVDRRDPDLSLHLRIHRNRAVISVDTSGASLHRRGYRLESVEAPLQETLAAAIIRLSGWNGDGPLYDPMCGSGTLLAEALMAGSRLPAALLRERFGFENLPDFDPAAWEAEKEAARRERRRLPRGLIAGSDIDGEAVKAARANLAVLPGGRDVRVARRDFRQIEGLEGAVIVCNPPYGQRLGKRARVEALYKDLGDHLKKRCKGATAWILCGDRELVGRLGLRPAKKIPLFNGGLECRLARIDVY